MQMARDAWLALVLTCCVVTGANARVLTPAAVDAVVASPTTVALPDLSASVPVPLDAPPDSNVSATASPSVTPAPASDEGANSEVANIVATVLAPAPASTVELQAPSAIAIAPDAVDSRPADSEPRAAARSTRGAAPPSAAPLAAALDAATHQDYSPVLRTFVLLSLLSILPVLLIGLTSFTRIIIVLSLLRHALGLPQTPPNSVLMTLAIFLTLFSMGPVIDRVGSDAVQPYLKEKITATQAIEAGAGPMKDFMIRQTRETDLAAVLEMARAPRPKTVADIQFGHLAPAFLLSELKTAFQIGFIIFLPFLLVDLVVAAILMALGMIMVPPSTISLPIKLLLFILVDGWVLISRALVGSYWS